MLGQDWRRFPPEFLMDEVIKAIRDDAEIAAANGAMLELRIASEEYAKIVADAVARATIPNVVVRYWPVN